MANPIDVNIALDVKRIQGANGSFLEVSKEGAGNITTAVDSFHDGFSTFDTANNWVASIDPADATIIGGVTGGAEYLKLSRSCELANTQSTIYSRVNFQVPTRVSVGLSLSQRVQGEEHYLELVGIGANNAPNIVGSVLPTPIGIVSLVVTTNVAKITLASTPLGIIDTLDRVVLYGCADSRLNVGAVQVTTVWPTEKVIFIPLTIANGTYTVTGGNVIRIDSFDNAIDGCGFIMEGVTSTNAIPVTRNDAGSALISAATSFGTAFTDALQGSVQPYAYSFQPRFNTELNLRPDMVEFISQSTDSLVAGTAYVKRTQSVPNHDRRYAVRVRSKNLLNKSIPVANIISVTKTGTTTATVTTDVAHGLNALDWIWAAGVSDFTNFPPITAQVQISSIINATSFTVVWGVTTTGTSWGGTVYRINGTMSPSLQPQRVQGFARNGTGYMMIGLSSAPVATLLHGDTIRIRGCRDNVGDMGIDGRYKVAHISPAIWVGNLTVGLATVTGIADTSLLAVGAFVTGTGIAASTTIISIQAGVGFTMSAVAITGATTGTIITQVGFLVEDSGAATQPTPGGGLTGGSFAKETDVRINFIKVFDYNRTPVEVVAGYNNGDAFQSTGVSVVNSGAMGIGSVGTITTVTTVATLTNVAQIGTVPTNSFILDTMHNAWCNVIRRAIT